MIVEWPIDEMRKGVSSMNVSDLPNRVHADPIVGYDNGDLLTDLDRQMGEAIERAVHRYMPVEIARNLRREIVDQIGEKIITFDRVLKEARV